MSSGGPSYSRFEGLARDSESEDDDFVEEQPAHWLHARNKSRLRRLIKDDDEEAEQVEVEDVGTLTAPRSRRNLRSRQKRSLLYDDEYEDDSDDDDEYQDSSNHIGTSTMSSCSRRKQKVDRDDDDNLWSGKGHGDEDPNDNEHSGEAEIGGADFDAVPASHLASESNRSGEML
ncbi:hypothetical protein BGZ70_004480, partial [Mortierella alpina]